MFLSLLLFLLSQFEFIYTADKSVRVWDITGREQEDSLHRNKFLFSGHSRKVSFDLSFIFPGLYLNMQICIPEEENWNPQDLEYKGH